MRAQSQVWNDTSGEIRGSGGGKLQSLTYALLVLFFVCFVAAQFSLAMRKPLWMDEVLCVWVVRLPSVQAVCSALFHGAEFSPPTYHLFLHLLARIAGSSYFVLRLPSVLAITLVMLCVFVIVRKHLGLAPAALATAFTAFTPLWRYTTEIRPYALVVLCFTVAVLLWDQLEQPRFFRLRVIGIAVLLVTATSLHLYAVLLVTCFGLMEAIWWIVNRRLRVAVWLGLLIAGASSLAWLPWIRVISRYNAGDSSSVAYYARPYNHILRETYSDLFAYSSNATYVLLVAIVGIALVHWLRATQWSVMRSEVSFTNERPSTSANIYILSFCAALFPIIVFVFARVVTHTFSLRYALAGSIGVACLIACCFGRLPALKWAILPVLLVSCWMTSREIPPQRFGDVMLQLITQASKPYPIVIGEGLQYFQIFEVAPAPLRSNLFYVTSPKGIVSPDPTNENQLKRWQPLKPELNVVDSDAFFARNPRFYLLHSTDSRDVLTPWLLERGLIEKPVANIGAAWLFEAQAPPARKDSAAALR
ncbi:MAG: glycosyltransferase family 39 protein [Acidobacteriaceae bacterium]|nr:glycosyltransferase family 39 protein [Acidobacteriaceae bacterium]